MLRDGLRSRALQVRRVLEDRLLQLRQLPARVETQLLLKGPSGAADGVERLGLPTGAVERHGQQPPAVLAERAGADEGGGVGHDVVAGGQSGTQQGLLRAATQLVQAKRLGPAVRPVLEIGQRRSAPQVQRLRKSDTGAPVLTLLAESVAASHQALEEPDVDLVVPEGQPVAAGGGLDGVVPQGPAQPQDRALHDLGPGRRRRRSPERVGEPLGRHAGAAVDDERRQHDPVPGREPSVTVHLQRAEQRERHEPDCARHLGITSTGLIPG